MRERREPAFLGDVLRGILDRLGVGDLDLWNRIQEEWPEVVGSPWDRQAKPIALTEGILVVEAVTPAAIGVLRYGTAGLKKTLNDRYGGEVIRDVRLRPPSAAHRR